MSAWTPIIDRLLHEDHFVPPRFTVVEIGSERELSLSFELLLKRIAAGGEHTTWVRGPGGSGKTTFVNMAIRNWLVRKDRRGHSDVMAPVVVTLRGLLTLRPWNLTPKEIALAFRPSGVEERVWKARIDRRRAVIIVDAINELERRLRLENDGRRLLQVLEKLIYLPADLPVLVTSRAAPAVERASEYIHRIEVVKLAPLTPADVNCVLGSRGFEPKIAMGNAADLGLKGALTNPYLLRLFCDYLRNKANVQKLRPQSRIDLLRLPSSEAQMHGRISGSERALEQQGLTLDAVLCAAGLEVLRQHHNQPDVGEMETMLAGVWEPVDVARISDLFFDTHLANKNEDKISFELQHDSLIDAGLAIGYRNQPLPLFAAMQDIAEHFAGNWVGLQSDPNNAAIETGVWLASQNRHDLIVDVLEANRGCLTAKTRRVLWRQVGKALAGSRAMRDRAIAILGQLGRDSVMDAIRNGIFQDAAGENLAALNTLDEMLRKGQLHAASYQTVYRKIRYGQREVFERKQPKSPRTESSGNRKGKKKENSNPGEIAALITKACHDPAPEVRVEAIKELRSVDSVNEAGLTSLITLLNQDTNANVRKSVAKTLGKIGAGNATVIDALVNSLSDMSALVRGGAATGLGLSGAKSPSAVAGLTLLTSDPDEVVRGSAANALGRIGASDTHVIDVLTHMMNGDSDNWNRSIAVSALGRISTNEKVATRALSDTLVSESAPVIRRSASNALGIIGIKHETAIQRLVDAVYDLNSLPKLRGSAATALGRTGINNTQVNVALIHLLKNDNDPWNRGAAANALGLIGADDETAIQALVDAVRDTEAPSDVRGSAAHALGLIGIDKETVIGALVNALRDANAVLDVRGSAANALGLIGTDNEIAIRALVDSLGDVGSPRNVRRSAANALGLIGTDNDTAIQVLVDALTDVNATSDVRGTAANALGNIGTDAESAIHALVNTLTDVKASSDVRGSAANALGLIGTDAESAVHALVNALTDVKASSDVRGSAANALGLIGANDTEVIRAIIHLMENDSDQWNRGAAANALGMIGSGEEMTINAIVRALTNPSNEASVRASAANALGLIGSDNDTAIQELVKALMDSGAAPRLRGAAVNALGRIGANATDIIQTIVHSLRSDSDPLVCASAANALGLIRTNAETAIQALVDTVKNVHISPDTRGSAANALGLIGTNKEIAIIALVEVVNDPNAPPKLRGSAANALGLIGTDEEMAIMALVEAVRDLNALPELRGSAANALGLIGTDEEMAIHALVDALRDTDAPSRIRGTAAHALGLIGSDENRAVQALVNALADVNSPLNVRESAACTLGLIGLNAEPAIQALVNALKDKNSPPKLRSSAANALGRIGANTPETIEAIVHSLRSDRDPRVRDSAANALGQIGTNDTTVIQALVDTLKNSVVPRGVRTTVARVLGLVGTDAELAIRALVETVEDTRVSKRIRGSAVDALGMLGANDETVIRALVPILSDANAGRHVRGSAASALGLIGAGHEDVVEALITGLQDVAAPPDTRGSVANVLGRMGRGDSIAMAALIQAVRSSTTPLAVRGSASYAVILTGTDPYPWAMQVYDELCSIRGLVGVEWKSLRITKGNLVAAVAGSKFREEHMVFLDRIVRLDPDYKSRTRAVQGLAAHNRLSANLIRFLIDPDYDRPDRRRGDTDHGVKGEVCRAVLSGFRDRSPQAEELQLVLSLLTNPATPKSIVTSACAALFDLEPLDRQRAARELRMHPLFRGNGLNATLLKTLGIVDEHITRESAAAASYDELLANPIQVLKTLKVERQKPITRQQPQDAQAAIYCFRPCPTGFEVRFGDESDTLPNRLGITYIHLLLRHPNKELNPLDFGDPTGIAYSAQEVSDGKERRQLKKMIDQLKDEVESERVRGNGERALDLEDEIAKLEKAYEDSSVLGTRLVRIFRDPSNLSVHRIRTRINDELRRLKEDKHPPSLVHHLTSFIRTDPFRYAPGPNMVPWELG